MVTIGSSTYNLWGSDLTVKAHGTLVLTETGAQNSTNFDGSDFAPNSYNGGNRLVRQLRCRPRREDHPGRVHDDLP